MAPFKSSWPPPYMSCQGGAAPKEATYFIHQRCHTSKGVIYTEEGVQLQSGVLTDVSVNRVLRLSSCQQIRDDPHVDTLVISEQRGVSWVTLSTLVLLIYLFLCNLQHKSFTRRHTPLLIHL